MSQNCINAQNTSNSLYNNFPGENWLGVISHLWTGNEEVVKFKDKYKIKYSLILDKSNEIHNKYKVKNFPTLILIKNNKEVFRTEKLDKINMIRNKIIQYRK